MTSVLPQSSRQPKIRSHPRVVMKNAVARVSQGIGATLIGLALVGLTALLTGDRGRLHLIEPAYAGGQVPKGPVLPFEPDFAARRHDRAVLAFNEHIAHVPGSRIRDLPMVNGRLGDRVTLTEGPTLHFPLGYLVTATYEFDKQRLRRGVATAAAAGDLEANPDYAFVKRFDAELGAVCARTEDKSSNTRVEFRIKPGKTMAVVLDMPGRYDALTKDASRSYAVFVGIEDRYVAVDKISRRLLAHCRSGTKNVEVAYDGEPISLAMLTGTAPQPGGAAK